MKGIAGKLILILFLSAILVLAVIGGMDYHAGKKLVDLEVEKELSEITKRLSISLRQPTYEFNRVAARDAILGEFSNAGLKEVLVWSVNRTNAIAGIVRQPDGSLTESTVLSLGEKLIHDKALVYMIPLDPTANGFVVGEIDVVFDRVPLEQKMIEELLIRQAKMALTVILLLLILSEVLRRSLVQPLEHIRQAMLLAEVSIDVDMSKDEEVLRLLEFPERMNKRAFTELRHMSKVFRSVLDSVWQRQAALHESEARYRELIEEADVLVVKMDTSFVCMYANPLVEKITGLTPTEAIGRRAVDFIHPDDRKRAWRTLVDFARGHFDHISIEFRMVSLDGRVTTLSWTVSIAYDYSGHPVYYRAIGKDVTAEKLSALKLQEDEEYFRTVIETSPDTIALIHSQDGTVLDVNNVALELFGFSRENLPQGKSTVEMNLWRDPTVRVKFVEALQSEGKIDNLETDFLTRDGRIFTGLVSARAIEHKGKPCHLAFIKDITTIKKTTFALQESEAKYRQLSQEFGAVLDGIVDSLVLLDPNMKVVWGNRGAMQQFNLSQEQLVGKSCHQLWVGCEGGPCAECVRSVFESGKAMESVRTTQDNRTWGVKGYPVFGADGKVVNVIQIASDLSEKMQLREEATRAAHLAALGGLSAGIAHEINNPTGLVLMALPMIKDSMQDLLPLLDDYAEEHPDLKVAGLPYSVFREEIMQTIDDVHGGANRIKRIVEDLKDFAREKSHEEDAEVNLKEMVEQGLRLLHNLLKNSTDHFVVDLEENLPTVKGSAQRLEQVLVNLLQNACQALTSREQSVRLRVSKCAVKKCVQLQVSDEGCGIPEAALNKITDPFFTTRREVGGSGLGLSVSTRIIEEHGGTLAIDSTPGKGSTFTIELPVANGEYS